MARPCASTTHAIDTSLHKQTLVVRRSRSTGLPFVSDSSTGVRANTRAAGLTRRLSFGIDVDGAPRRRFAIAKRHRKQLVDPPCGPVEYHAIFMRSEKTTVAYQH